jgi:WhiB family redox-sensing transcriptional regulator
MARAPQAQYPDFRAASVPCAETDPEAWFPEKGCRAEPVVFALCAGCPVAVRCREWGIEHQELGIWGGTTELERRAIRRDRKAAA